MRRTDDLELPRERGDRTGLESDAVAELGPAVGARPWNDPTALRGVAFALLWTTGPDPEREGVFRLQALRPAAQHGSGEPVAWERFDRFCDPFGTGAGTAGDAGAAPEGASKERTRATARMAREFGVTGQQLAQGAPAEEAWSELAEFLGSRPLIVPDADSFQAWAARLGLGELYPGPVLGLAEIAGLLFPGRLAADREVLCANLLPSHPQLPRAVGPVELHAALSRLVGRFLVQREAVLGVAAHGWAQAFPRLARVEPAAARQLGMALSLVEHPSQWRRAGDELFSAHPGLQDGRLSAAFDAFEALGHALEEARPVWTVDERDKPMPQDTDEEAARFHEDDRRRLDEIFEVHLPRHFTRGAPGREGEGYRKSQHEVARAVADSLGAGELLLVHAPTGTGKTLAYLVPALLWARRHGVRIGLATYTRALQEQAMDQEVPLALELLRRSQTEPEPAPRVALLKGRANYLCWRSLRAQQPEPTDAPQAVLAWLTLALFALSDPDGDLDRLPRRPCLEFGSGRAGDGSELLDAVIGLVRAEVGCCKRRDDRDTCGGECARHRSERAHVVVTNHAFALSKRDFFKHVVFDECEHLHDCAHGAWSHETRLSAVRRLLERIHGGGSRTGPLERLRFAALRGTDARLAAEQGTAACEATLVALDRLEATLFGFKLWRNEERARRRERDTHSLFREYAQGEQAGELLIAHSALLKHGAQVGASLAQMSEHLDELAVTGKPRLRRTLELLRTELEEAVEALGAWIPYEDGLPGFRPDTFYDLSSAQRGGDLLAARVLLPHEFLGRHYYPNLRGAVFLSATTWMKGGFDASAGYLGLTRAAMPAEDETRPPCRVRTFRAPEVFDYSRVRVLVPRDAPSYRDGKHLFLEYVTRFVAHLTERTRGRALVLFTSADDCKSVGERLLPFFAARRTPFWYQGMRGAGKEELSELFRARVDSVLMGLDTFWYGANFPGETLEYLVIVKLPYGVPDAYHHAQAAAMGEGEQRRAIYMPRALAKFRQGFGRLMRKETDRGCVFVLDGRVLDPRHRSFLQELPLQDLLGTSPEPGGATLVRGDTDRCLHEALAHMGMLADVSQRGLDTPFGRSPLSGAESAGRDAAREGPEDPEPFAVAAEDLPF